MKQARGLPPVGPGTVAPLAIGPANCEAALGVNWRWLRDHAEALGLTVLRVDGKPFVEASAALEAIRRHGAPQVEAASAPEHVEDIETIRARLGLRRRAC